MRKKDNLGLQGEAFSMPTTPDFWRTSLNPDRETFLRKAIIERREKCLDELLSASMDISPYRMAELKGQVQMLDYLFGESFGKQLYLDFKVWLSKEGS